MMKIVTSRTIVLSFTLYDYANPVGWTCKDETSQITGQGPTIEAALRSWVEGHIRRLAENPKQDSPKSNGSGESAL